MVSLIVPVFNASQYLNRCVKSIQRQVYTDFEVILVDDGSTDDSLLLCDSFAKTDARFVVLHQENQGPAAARNLGLSVAKGEFICFMDSDDEITDSYLLDLTIGIKENDLVIHGFTRICDKARHTCEIQFVQEYDLKENAQLFFDNIVIDQFGGPYCKLFKKDVLDAFNIRFNSKIHLAEDLDFLLRYLVHCCFVVVENKSNYFYYDTPGSACSKIYSYENEWDGACALEQSWNELSRKYPVESLIKIKDRAFAYYVSRLLASISSQDKNYKQKNKYYCVVNDCFWNCYEKYFVPETIFLKIIKFFAVKKCFLLVDILFKLSKMKANFIWKQKK